MWFRSDLRVNDNTALTRACEESTGGVVAVFAVCGRQWRERHDWGDTRVAFLLRNLEALKERLGSINVPLRIVSCETFEGVAERLVSVARETGCERLYFNREYEWNEQRRDEAVADAFSEAGLSCCGYHDQVLYEPGTVLTKSGDSFYTVYSPFKKACWKRFEEEGAWEVLAAPRSQAEIDDVDGDDVPTRVDGFGETDVDLADWPAGEQAASNRLHAFVRHRIEGYKDARDFPARDETSRISAHLAVGVLSPRQCMRAALEENGGAISSGNAGAVGWMEEILWREFYRHVLVGYPRVSRGRNFNTDYDGLPWRSAPDDLEAWKDGRTGYPIVDAAMRCLRETGWMHNRLRMVVAMFLTKHLLIDWREGERHFMQHLIDGDFAANNGGWQWSASTGTDAQPYFRIFNPTSQGEKFDPDGAFVKKWIPELGGVPAKAVHEPHAKFKGDLSGYPKPIVGQREGRERALEVFKSHRSGK